MGFGTRLAPKIKNGCQKWRRVRQTNSFDNIPVTIATLMEKVMKDIDVNSKTAVLIHYL